MASRIKSWIRGRDIVTENSSDARLLNDSHSYGVLLGDGRVKLSIVEAAFLLDKRKLSVFDGGDVELCLDDFLGFASSRDKFFGARFVVYRDLRSRGYIVKTGLKFGADFRVYDKGSGIGVDHSRWVCYVVREHDRHSWHDFSCKNRIAHSTKKRLLMAVVDDDDSVSYWESKWVRL